MSELTYIFRLFDLHNQQMCLQRKLRILLVYIQLGKYRQLFERWTTSINHFWTFKFNLFFNILFVFLPDLKSILAQTRDGVPKTFKTSKTFNFGILSSNVFLNLSLISG
jgi:hypothetical protein